MELSLNMWNAILYSLINIIKKKGEDSWAVMDEFILGSWKMGRSAALAKEFQIWSFAKGCGIT